MPKERTAVGVDIGEHNLYAACPVTMPDWIGAYVIRGDDVCAHLDELRAQTAAHLASGTDRDTIRSAITEHHTAICTKIDDAARTICEYATAYDDPVLVTEDSNHETDLWAWLTDPNAHRGTAWLLPAAHRRLRAVAAEYALEVTTVPESYSSLECHACGVIGERVRSQTVCCTNPNCYVGGVYADCNAAKVLAQRYYPGQRCAYRPTRSGTPDEGHAAPADRHATTDIRHAMLADGGQREHDG
ncbi:transposase, IS605 OrfB family protein [Natrialba chahannaoensis JCM 10990]|uniref:Transposase, IS605 OrfB family protein n=1 Tax=Natrialba chahannaoensis JCM 10990 TaxID=1227492 RepID=M0APP4_9EURY|nr:zinc ribbon domain-containing protein [Natrialba chahannaoensis]ELZ00302.1 transposase, IS605 OrfB family protein [Natrialba chahannaoensis JCM 10990]